MFRLRDQVGRDPFGIEAAGDDDDFRGAGIEIDRAVAGHQRLRRRDVAIARPDDLVDARNGGGAVRERRDRVRAADAEQLRDARFERGGHDRGVRPRADRDDVPNAGDARGHRRHQQRRGQREAAARHVTADACERLDALLDRHAGHDVEIKMGRNLPERHPCDVARRVFNRAPDRRLDFRRLTLHFLRRYLERARPGGLRGG